jgi:transposase
LAKGRLKEKRASLEEALVGIMGPHQRFMLASLLRSLDFLEQEIDQLNEESGKRLAPFAEALERIDTIPGIGRRAGEEILAETRVNMSLFPNSAHLASWAGMCPEQNEVGETEKWG